MPRQRQIIPIVLAAVLACCALAPSGGLAFEFQATSGSTLEGKRSGPDHFVLRGIEEECKQGFFEGTFYRRTLELVPIFGKCIAKELDGLDSTFVLDRCAYLVHSKGRKEKRGRWLAEVDLTCPTNYSLRWQLYEPGNIHEPVCATLMYPQTKIGMALLSNMNGRPRELTIHWNLNELEFEAAVSNFLCGIPEGITARGASYTGYTRVRAVDPLKRPTSLAVVG